MVRKTLTTTAAAAAMALIVPAGAWGANFNVTRTDDPDTTVGQCPTAGPCSLRQAITAANANTSANVITLPAGTFTISNTLGSLPQLGYQTAINGQGPASTIIDAGGGTNVTAGLRFGDSAGAVADSVSGLTIQNITNTGNAAVLSNFSNSVGRSARVW